MKNPQVKAWGFLLYGFEFELLERSDNTPPSGLLRKRPAVPH